MSVSVTLTHNIHPYDTHPCRCEVCPAGKRADSTVSLCLDCLIGKYASEPMSANCEVCENPRTTSREGAKNW